MPRRCRVSSHRGRNRCDTVCVKSDDAGRSCVLMRQRSVGRSRLVRQADTTSRGRGGLAAAGNRARCRCPDGHDKRECHVLSTIGAPLPSVGPASGRTEGVHDRPGCGNREPSRAHDRSSRWYVARRFKAEEPHEALPTFATGAPMTPRLALRALEAGAEIAANRVNGWRKPLLHSKTSNRSRPRCEPRAFPLNAETRRVERVSLPASVVEAVVAQQSPIAIICRNPQSQSWVHITNRLTHLHPTQRFAYVLPMRNDSPGTAILTQWRRLSVLPGGGWLFSKLLGWQVPYSGSVSPRVLLLEPGHARVRIRERRALRQHLGSVHAIALMNVAELASGLAMLGALPAGMRGIVTKISIEYFKKARGTLVAESRCVVSPDLPEGEYDFQSEVQDAAGDLVARATVTWKLGPVPA
ncbi:MAG: hypothetical protein C0497_02510 [Gemmatimonas sp.]|nr:hypothetical protein [Gemmatimonas sp.]